jgi:maleate cis-trans isomerase
MISRRWCSASSALPFRHRITLLAAHGFEVISFANVQGVTNIYDETPERAYTLARMVDREDAEAVFLSGTGMPTLPVLEMLETALGKPVSRAQPR